MRRMFASAPGLSVALFVSKWRLGRISPMLWLSTLLIVGFGSLTVWLNDPFYIQVKPTVIYIFFAAVLFGGLLRGKAMLKYLLQSAFDGLSDEGWQLDHQVVREGFIASLICRSALSAIPFPAPGLPPVSQQTLHNRIRLSRHLLDLAATLP